MPENPEQISADRSKDRTNICPEAEIEPLRHKGRQTQWQVITKKQTKYTLKVIRKKLKLIYIFEKKNFSKEAFLPFYVYSKDFNSRFNHKNALVTLVLQISYLLLTHEITDQPDAFQFRSADFIGIRYYKI